MLLPHLDDLLGGRGLGRRIGEAGRDADRAGFHRLDDMFLHGGDFGGYRSAALYDSGLDIALAVQGNAKAFEAPDFAFATIDALAAD